MTIPPPKVTSQHLARKAVVYLRQSSAKQVHENLQSQRLQYALREKAITWGFRDVEIIDEDLGSSAALGARERDGFTQLLGRVALGEVGLVLSIEVARLSRTDKDWCHLLELCQVFGTLIADADHIYDLSTMDDQLVLGIKGTLSVVELKVLKNRLLRGQEEKARRGNCSASSRRDTGVMARIAWSKIRICGFRRQSSWCLRNSARAGAAVRPTCGSSRTR